MKCKICKEHFKESDDNLVMCKHKKGVVHKSCCINNCSMHGEICEHGFAEYSKVIKEQNE